MSEPASNQQTFDPYAYAATQGAAASSQEEFDPYAYAASTAANYTAPSVGAGNSWKDALEGAPQALGSGVVRWAADVAGEPANVATDVVNLGKSGIEAAYLAAGKIPPTWLDPTSYAKTPLSSDWIKNQLRAHLGASTVDVTGDPQSYLDQALSEGAEVVGPTPFLEGSPGQLAVARTPEDVLASNVPAQQSLSAAAASPRLANTSPQLRQAIVRAAQKTGGAVNPDALVRHIEADTLPVPVQLTEGQALQDPVRLSNEQNIRGQQTDLARRFSEQNGHLKQNLQAVRDDVGPDVFSANHVEHGDTLIKAYQDKADAADADIDAKYQALRDANGGKFPVDVKALASNVESALHDHLLYEHAPTELGQLQALAKGGNMTFEQFEAMRTNLARTMRSSSDGNEKAAAGIIRKQMENLPLTGETAKLKPLADAARSAAKAQFDALDADPAYKAAVRGSVSPDRFVQKFVINAPRDDIATMRKNLEGDPVAQQTIGVSTVDHLRRAAGVDDMGNGNFSQANFNKQLQALGPKIGLLLSPRDAETLEQVGNVARYTQAQPRGSFVNNSNTLVGTLAEHGGNILEHAANAKTGGIGGTLVRQGLARRAARKEIQRILAPGAGLDVLQ